MSFRRTLAVAACLTGLGSWTPAAAGVLRVDAAAGGAATGASWADAFPSLQDALAAAGPGDQLWVAAGLYRPDQGAAQAPGDRLATFALPAGVSLYGGFAGDELLLSDRAGLFGATLLDGDLLGDDAGGFGFDADNSHHVVTCAAEGVVRLDGFRVRGGQAEFQPSGGGGLLVTASDAVLVDCVFEENTGSTFLGGGGAAIEGGTARFERCTFRDNQAATICNFIAGGGLHNLTTTWLEDCVFEGNRASCNDLVAVGRGGAVASSGTLVASGCRFDGNLATAFGSDGSSSLGGAINAQGSVLLSACHFTGNEAVGASTGRGGGAYLHHGTATLVNCVFSGNRVTADITQGSGGGGLSLDEVDAVVVGSTFAGNVAHGGFFFAALRGAGLHFEDTTVSVSSSVFWGNEVTGFSVPALEAQQIDQSFGGVLSMDHCDVEGLSGALGGVGNVGLDPLFVDADGADDVLGTADDDLRLQAGSPCVDAGDHTALPADTLDLDGDGDALEATPWDVDGRERRHDDAATPDGGVGPAPVMDMGAHEFGAPFPVWLNLGQGLAGAAGEALLVGQGPLAPDTVFALVMTGAAPSSGAWLVLGAAAAEVSFKGGVLVPAPDLVFGPVDTGADGALTLEARWPAGLPAGVQLHAQVWVQDGGAPAGWAASNGVRGTAP